MNKKNSSSNNNEVIVDELEKDLKIELRKAKAKQYSHKCYEKNKEIKFTCEICGGKYTYFNKSHHNTSLKHRFIIQKYELDNLKNKE